MNNRYTLLKSQCGEPVPALIRPSGDTKPLHSMVDPKREAQRLVSTITDDTGFVIFLGLGGGFVPETVLANTDMQVVVIDYCIGELLSLKDYSTILNNERFTLLHDPSGEQIKDFILKNYRPSISGGIKTIPLRTSMEFNLPLFETAIEAIQEAIEIVSSDYSVQAHFGMRWFSNIIRNFKNIENTEEEFIQKHFTTQISKAAIVAAGPSLDLQLPALEKFKTEGGFVICSDTALPVLMHYDIKPDTVISIDCQHISYYHFMGCYLQSGIPLILDIASPPLLSGFSTSSVFFSSGHPFAQYISAKWHSFMQLDTSGGNVTYACLSFAQFTGAQHITLFGADFSYINSSSYAKGTYIYPYFERKQNRLCPSETLFSKFLYRSPFLPQEKQDEKAERKQNYYETSQLRFYRKKLEEKASSMSEQITAVDGQGAPVNLTYKTKGKEKASDFTDITIRKPVMSSIEFLEKYRDDIAALTKNINSAKEKQILATLLPYAAALKHREPAIKTKDLIEEAKHRCIMEIDRILAT